MKFIEKYPNKNWCWYYISKNSNFTMEIIEKNIDKYRWNWWGISENPNLTIEFIEKYPNNNWRWGYILMNPNFTMEIIEKHIDKFNCDIWKSISHNPNITMEFIEKHLDKINFGNLSFNRFNWKKYKKMSEEFKQQLSEVAEAMHEHIMYKTDGIGYHESKKHFEKMQTNIN